MAASVVKINVETSPVHRRVIGIFTHGNLVLKKEASSPFPIQSTDHMIAEKKDVRKNFDKSSLHEVHVKKVMANEPRMEKVITPPYSLTLLMLCVTGFSKLSSI
jgi:hypothetical protein